MATTDNQRFTQGPNRITPADIGFTVPKTGWAAWTGTPTRTTIATGSATATNCAEALMALIADLTAAGILST